MTYPIILQLGENQMQRGLDVDGEVEFERKLGEAPSGSIQGLLFGLCSKLLRHDDVEGYIVDALR